MTTDIVLEDGEVVEPDTQRQLATVSQSQGVTPAQAKIDAVANLTMRMYERASLLQLTPEEQTALQAEFPDSAFQPGAGGKQELIYIEHAFLRDRMIEVFGPGQWSLIVRSRWTEPFETSNKKKGIRVYVEAMLCARGCFISEAIGDMSYYPANDATNFGDAVEGAKSAAFRRCVKELGVGLQAWKKDWCKQWWERRRSGKPATNGEPAEKMQSDTFKVWLAEIPKPKTLAGLQKLFKEFQEKSGCSEDEEKEFGELLDQRKTELAETVKK